jgi:hypothetical protein
MSCASGLAMTQTVSAATAWVSPSRRPMNDLARELGDALGIAVIGSVLAATYRSHLTLPGLPAAVADKARDSFAIAAHIGGPVADRASSAFVDGLQLALLVGAGAARFAAVVVVLLLPRRARQRP